MPDQAAITAFLRGLLKEGRTQVSWAADAGIAYNTVTNYFTAGAPKMSAENLLRLVVSAGAVEDFSVWLAKYGATFHNGRSGEPTSEASKPGRYPLKEVSPPDEGSGRASSKGGKGNR